MKSTSTTGRTRTRLVLAAAVIAGSIAASSPAAAQDGLPTWEQCEYRDLPIAAGLGGILPVNFVPPPETQAALLGEIVIGTDCSLYDLPV